MSDMNVWHSLYHIVMVGIFIAVAFYLYNDSKKLRWQKLLLSAYTLFMLVAVYTHVKFVVLSAFRFLGGE